MSSQGGIATAKILRAQALKRYYANPSVCKHCGKIIEVKDGHKIQESRRKSFCNQVCNGRYYGHGFYLGEESCRKISAALKGRKISDATRFLISKKLKGVKREPLSAERKQKLREGRLKYVITPETRRKLSLFACSNRHKTNNFKHVPFIPFVKLDGTHITLRGSFEVRFAKYLDNHGYGWEYAKRLSYISSTGIQRYMLPDFYIASMDGYFDTKGYLSKECAEKIRLVKEQQGIIIHLVFLKDLEKLENGIYNLDSFNCGTASSGAGTGS